MIEFFEGKVGAGKSYSAALRIWSRIITGGRVATNMEINREATEELLAKRLNIRLTEWPIQFITNEQMPKFYEYLPYLDPNSPGLFVVDEVHLFFGSRDWAKMGPKVSAWLSQSRKAGWDAIFITQEKNLVDTSFRRQAQYFWSFRDTSKITIPLIGSWPFGAQVLSTQRDYDGRHVHYWSLRARQDWVFRMYESTAFLDEASQKKAREIERLASVQVERIPRRGVLKFLLGP